MIAPTATPTPIPALAPVERPPFVSFVLVFVVGVASEVLEVLAVLEALDAELVVCGVKSPAFQRIEIPGALMPSALVVLDVVPAFVKVQTCVDVGL